MNEIKRGSLVFVLSENVGEFYSAKVIRVNKDSYRVVRTYGARTMHTISKGKVILQDGQ